MEEITNTRRNVILILDQYKEDGIRLQNSLNLAYPNLLSVVLQDDDFLPRGIFSVFQLIAGYPNEMDGEERPVFYNEIKVPELWTVDAKERKYGTVTYLHQEKAKLNFIPGRNLIVESVDWLDRDGKKRLTEHYNKFGKIAAKTVYDSNGKPINKTWFTTENREIISQNLVTGHYIYNCGKSEKVFHSVLDLVAYYMESEGLTNEHIVYNSLANPFFLNMRLSNNTSEDILFWQEPIKDEIPGNMQQILNGQAARTHRIIVQRIDAYQRLIQLGVLEKQIEKIGYIYPFVRENQHRKDALICTNSDQIEHIKELIEKFSDIHFHITAVTNMSETLLDLDVYENVSLYPSVSETKLDKLFDICDFYFDINYGIEMSSSIYRAFIHNQLIIAFEETIHDSKYIAKSHIYKIMDVETMYKAIHNLIEDKKILEQALLDQHAAAMVTNVGEFQQVLQLN